MLSVCLENFTEERVKKKQSQEEEKNGFSRHAHAARIFSVRERRERGRGKDRAIVSRISIRSTYLRGTGDSRDKTSDKSKIKGGKKQHVILDTNDFCAKTRRCRKATRERRFIISIRVTRLPIDHVFHFGGEIRKARILFTI